MKYDWLDAYLLQKRGVTKDLQPVWNWVRYHIGGKMFAAVCLDDAGRPYYINLRLEPMNGEFLRAQYAGDVIPGYYSDKVHWNSVNPDGAVPDDTLRAMLDESYRLVLGGLPKKRQREALGLTCCGTECGGCAFFEKECAGCNALAGKAFHAPPGRACPIYACAVNRNHRATCAGCEKLPCEIWKSTRDPQLSDAAFADSIAQRVRNLKGE